MDLAILKFVQEHCRNRFTDFVFTLLSRMGNAGAVWILTAVFLWHRSETRHFAFMLFFSIALAHLISQILKPVIARPRPFMTYPGHPLLIHTPGGYSCPSGHSASSFAAATILCVAGRNFGLAAFFLAVAIAFSRIFLFVHYPSDTLIGAALGVLCAFFIMYLYTL